MSSTLQLKIIKATDIYAADRSGTSDPYLSCFLMSEKGNNAIKTLVIKKTVNPEWNLDVKFSAIQNDEHVVFVLHDWNRFQSDKLIGRCELPIKDLKEGLQKKELEFDKGGVLHLEYKFTNANPPENLTEGFKLYKTYPWSIELHSSYSMEDFDKDLGRVWFRENDFERFGIFHHNNHQDLKLIIDQSIDYHEIVKEMQIFRDQNKYEEEIYTQSIKNNYIFHNLFVKYDQSIVRFCKQVLKDYENQDFQVLPFLQKLSNDLKIKEKRIKVSNGIMNFWCDRIVNLLNVTNLSACNHSTNSHGSFFAEVNANNGEWNCNFTGNGWNGAISVMGNDSTSGKKVLFETEKFTIFPEDLEPGKIYEEKLFIDRLAHVVFRFQYLPEIREFGMKELEKRTKVEWPKGESTDSNGRNVFSIGKYMKLHLPSSFVEKKMRLETMLIGEYETIRFVLTAKADLDDSSDFMQEIAKKKPISTSDITNQVSNTTCDKIILAQGISFIIVHAWKANIKIVLSILFADSTVFEVAKTFLLDTLQDAEISFE